MPLCVGGGIRDYVDEHGAAHSALAVAAAYFRAGADKVSIGSEVSLEGAARPCRAPRTISPPRCGSRRTLMLRSLFGSAEARGARSRALTRSPVPSLRPCLRSRSVRRSAAVAPLAWLHSASQAVAAAKAYWARGQKGDGGSCIEQIAHVYGRQAVVISIDPRRVWVDAPAVAGAHAAACVESPQGAVGPKGERFCWYECTVKGGREGSDLDVVQLARGCEALGAGELLLNSIDADGQNKGFDIALVAQVKGAVTIPVIASSGAGKVEDFSSVFEATDVEVRAARLGNMRLPC